MAQMDVKKDIEERFNEVYNREHIPLIEAVPGVMHCYRFRTYRSNSPEYPRYTALYLLESPEIVTGPEWRQAADTGSWAPEIRPFTFNKMLTVLEALTVKE
jgi:hypothetical protein